jgi:hypothetical protein
MAQLIPYPLESFLPDAATNFPQYLAQMPAGTFRSALAFSQSVSQKCRSPQIHMPSFTGALSIKVTFAISPTSGNVAFRVAVEAISPADAINVNTTRSFDTANTSGSISVPASTYNTKDIVITLTNNDSVAAGDLFTFTLDRDVSIGSNATNICYILAVSLEDAS